MKIFGLVIKSSKEHSKAEAQLIIKESEEYQRGLTQGYRLGYQAGMVQARNGQYARMERGKEEDHRTLYEAYRILWEKEAREGDL